MNTHVLTAAQGFVEKATAKGRKGAVADAAKLSALNQEMDGRIPEWLMELLTRVPLCGLVLGVETSEGSHSVGWNGVRGMRNESLEAYPGVAILERGFLNVASDFTGGGDPFFIAVDDGDDPPLYQVSHDVGEEAGEILAAGRVPVAESLSSLFLTAQPE